MKIYLRKGNVSNGRGKWQSSIHTGKGGANSMVVGRNGGFWFCIKILFDYHSWIKYYRISKWRRKSINPKHPQK